MATFPALIPSSRIFTPGDHAHTALRARGGRSTQVRHSNVITGQRVRLSYKALTEAQVVQLRGHYITQGGQFFTFSLPPAVWTGVSDRTLPGYSWLYVAMPKVEEGPPGLFNVSVDLEMLAEIGVSFGDWRWDELTQNWQYAGTSDDWNWVEPQQEWEWVGEGAETGSPPYTPPLGAPTTQDPIIAVPLARAIVRALAPEIFGTTIVAFIDVPAASVAVAGLAPEVIGDLGVLIPVASIAVTGLSPQVTGDLPSSLVAVPAAAIAVTALAPEVAGDIGIFIPAASIAVTALAPEVVGDIGLFIPAASIAVTALAPEVGGNSPLTFIAASDTVYRFSATHSESAVPAASQNGDLLLAFIHHRSAVTPPAGWGLVRAEGPGSSPDTTGTTQFLSVYSRSDNGTVGGTSPTWTQALSNRFAVHYHVWRNAGVVSTEGTSSIETSRGFVPYVPISSTAVGQYAVAACGAIHAFTPGTVTATVGTLTTPSDATNNRLYVARSDELASPQTFSGDWDVNVTTQLATLPRITVLLG